MRKTLCFAIFSILLSACAGPKYKMPDEEYLKLLGKQMILSSVFIRS